MKKVILNLATIFAAVVLLSQLSVHAASLGFDSASSQTAVGSTTTVAVTINAGTEEISGTDIYVSFDSTKLELQSVTAGSYFPTVTNTPGTGSVYISGVIANPGEFKTGSGTVAQLVFKGLAAGTTTLSFDCNLTQADTSKIIKNDINATNVIDCSALGSHTVTIGEGTGATGTTGTTGTSTSTTTTTSTTYSPTSLPQSGVYDSVLQYSVAGVALLLVGIALKFIL